MPEQFRIFFSIYLFVDWLISLYFKYTISIRLQYFTFELFRHIHYVCSHLLSEAQVFIFDGPCNMRENNFRQPIRLKFCVALYVATPTGCVERAWMVLLNGGQGH
jgi:hypothetical protein